MAQRVRFNNVALETKMIRDHVTAIMPTWNELHGFFGLQNEVNLKSNIVWGTKTADDFYEIVHNATDASLKLSKELSEIKFDPLYLELTPAEYKRQFETYSPIQQNFWLSTSSMRSMLCTVIEDIDPDYLELAMCDALWLIAKCDIGVDMRTKVGPTGSYMALMKKLSTLFNAELHTPPTYDDGERFNAMLYIARKTKEHNMEKFTVKRKAPQEPLSK